jgi:protein tyrosine/serine phosphatase
MTRHIPLQGIENFRDFGGYAAVGGRDLITGRLYRSGHHGRATDADLETLAGLGIAVIVDLRRPNEREKEPSRRWPDFDAKVISSDAEQERTTEWNDFLKESDLSIEAFRGYMLAYYDAAPTDPRYIDLYRRYFRALAETEGAVLVHCAAGKDRTGVICALTHHMAGVHDDDIVHDYLLTNDRARTAARTQAVKQMIFETTGRMPTDAAVEYAIGVQPEFLVAAFGAMRARFGSVDGYLEGALGLEPKLRQRIHERLLARP